MTAQVSEKLLIDGVERQMTFSPPLPLESGAIEEVGRSEIAARITAGTWPRYIESTACWRGYIATWEVVEGRLYLKDVIGRYRKTEEALLPATWFTGVLRVPLGNLLKPIHMGFASVYERELHIRIQDGVVLRQREIDNSDRPIDPATRGIANLPGGENRFEGDDF